MFLSGSSHAALALACLALIAVALAALPCVDFARGGVDPALPTVDLAALAAADIARAGAALAAAAVDLALAAVKALVAGDHAHTYRVATLQKGTNNPAVLADFDAVDVARAAGDAAPNQAALHVEGHLVEKTV